MTETVNKVVVIGAAEEADRGSWVSDVDGQMFVRSREIKAFSIRQMATGDFGLVAILELSGDDPNYIVVDLGLTKDEATQALIELLT